MKNATLSIGFLVAASAAQADSITHYGAISGNFTDEVPYAENKPTDDPYNANLGLGLSYGLVYRDEEGPLFGRPMEYGLEAGVLRGSETTGDAVGGSCDVETYIGLIYDCQDVANFDSLTYWIDASAMVNFGQAGGATDLLAGIGALHYGSITNTEFLYPTGWENFIDRDTTFTGAGIKVGARHRIEMQNGMTLNLAGFGGAYAGERVTDIYDLELDTGSGGVFLDEQSMTVRDRTTVYTLELRPSIDIPVDWIGVGSTFEVGISHKIFLNAIDSTGYGQHLSVDLGGDMNGSFSATSIFAGITIPM